MKNLLKVAYNRVPLKKTLYQGLRYFYTPKQKLYQHMHFVDQFNVPVSKGRSFDIQHYGFQIENELFWKGIFGGFEKCSFQLWAELCIEAGTIFDVGANTGVYSLLAKAVNPDAKVFAFEPVRRVFEKLVRNNELNDYDIVCVEKAASNFSGEATIYDTKSPHTYSVTVNEDTNLNQEDSIPISIETVRLDSFIQTHNVPRVDLAKIDVETHEAEVLEGLKEEIERHKPTLLVEILNKKVAEGIRDVISEIDYVYYNIDESRGVRKVDSLSQSDGFNFLICQPEIAEKLQSLKKLSA